MKHIMKKAILTLGLFTLVVLTSFTTENQSKNNVASVDTGGVGTSGTPTGTSGGQGTGGTQGNDLNTGANNKKLDFA